MKNNIIFDFKKSVALIIGGSRGIGLTVANEFLKSGAIVYIASRNNEHKGNHKHLKCDVRDVNQLKKLFSKIYKKENKIDYVVNCVAINECKKIDRITENEWEILFETNIKSYFFSCKEAIKIMKKNSFGVIVNVSSIAGRHRSIVSGSHYVASKSGILGLTRQLSYEVASYGIRVNAVCPSQTMTDMLKNSMTDSELRSLCKNIPLGRIASTSEQAFPILFLCSNEASYITGAIIDVNGGQL